MTRTEELLALAESLNGFEGVVVNIETIKQLVELVRLLVPLVEDCCDSHMEYDNTKHKQAIEAFNKWESGK